MMRRAFRSPDRAVLTLAVLCCTALLAGCEEDVFPALGLDRPFTLYGYIDPASDTQFVRVFPIENQLRPTRSDPLDAHVTSHDLQTGAEHVWQDSLLQYPDGTYGHLYWAPFRAEAGHTYTIEVARSDGATSRATVTPPPVTEALLRDPEVFGRNVILPVFLEGSVPRILQPRIAYWVRAAIPESERTFTFPYEEQLQKVEGGWLLRIEFSKDFFTVYDLLGEAGLLTCHPEAVILLNVTLRLMVVDEAWNPPGGVFDPDVLVQPGTMSNVENGFGFIGSGYHVVKTWRPPAEAITAAGYVPPSEGVPSCSGPPG